jgi:hypothetical protein
MLNFGGGQVGPVPFEGSYSVDGNCTFNSRLVVPVSTALSHSAATESEH